MNPHTDEILEGLRPRMKAARVGHVRRMIACLAMVPILGLGAAAMAADGADQPATETAHDGGDDADAPDHDLPDIGDADGDVHDAPESDDTDGDDDDGTDGDDTPEPVVAEEETKVLSLGPLGAAEVAVDGDGFELLHTDLVAGWEIYSIDLTDDGIRIVIKKGDVIKIITIFEGVRDELQVDVSDLVIPTTTTTTTTTTVKYDEPEPVVDRFEVVVEGKGSFIVEREGETLWVGNVSPNEGYDHDIIQGEGWKVYVGFTNGEWIWYGKALINDFGEVELHFWDEAPPFEPIYQWVEVEGVGAVKFKLWSDGLVYVKEWELAEGIGFWDYNQGSPAEIAKIDFEGDGILWIVEAWGNEEGGLSVSKTNQSPE
ncbi:MAG: hypothetical protein DHS20C19_13440 [Acidimicrobiales bacterium]|nr:MAG: hypothetical protein DHS20C19_13440 [Acidimicrobiales bacterium]